MLITNCDRLILKSIDFDHFMDNIKTIKVIKSNYKKQRDEILKFFISFFIRVYLLYLIC